MCLCMCGREGWCLLPLVLLLLLVEVPLELLLLELNLVLLEMLLLELLLLLLDAELLLLILLLALELSPLLKLLLELEVMLLIECGSHCPGRGGTNRSTGTRSTHLMHGSSLGKGT